MHKIEFPSTGKVIEFPSEINEMSSDQYTQFSGLVYQFTNQQISFAELKIKLTYVLLNMDRKVDVSKESEKVDRVSENVLMISHLMEGFFKTESKDGKQFKTIILNSIQNHIPEVGKKKDLFIGPKAALTDCTFAQYIQALNAFHDFAKTNDQHYLDMLFAILYKPKGSVYDTKQIDELSSNSLQFDIGIKYGVYLFFAACQDWIVNNKDLQIGGGNSVDLTVLFKPNENTEPGDQKGIGMLSALYSLAESGVFGDMEKAGKQNLYDALVYMVQKHNEVEKMKRDAKNNRAKGVPRRN